mgnify:CR=1 FL=1
MPFQVNSTALNLENCETQLYPIEITPTIPVRKIQGLGLPRLSFYTPREAIILEGCEVELKQGIEPVRIVVKAACQQPNQVSVGLKPIIPHISYSNSLFWNQWIGLPTIWVIIIFLFLSPLFCHQTLRYKFIFISFSSPSKGKKRSSWETESIANFTSERMHVIQIINNFYFISSSPFPYFAT